MKGRFLERFVALFHIGSFIGYVQFVTRSRTGESNDEDDKGRGKKFGSHTHKITILKRTNNSDRNQ